MLSDIQIAQQTTLTPIIEIAAQLDISADELELYVSIRLSFLMSLPKE